MLASATTAEALLTMGRDATYALHTAAAFVGPPNRTLLLLANGLGAKLGSARPARLAG
jgi:hypothetical protein